MVPSGVGAATSAAPAGNRPAADLKTAPPLFLTRPNQDNVSVIVTSDVERMKMSRRQENVQRKGGNSETKFFFFAFIIIFRVLELRASFDLTYLIEKLDKYSQMKSNKIL